MSLDAKVTGSSQYACIFMAGKGIYYFCAMLRIASSCIHPIYYCVKLAFWNYAIKKQLMVLGIIGLVSTILEATIAMLVHGLQSEHIEGLITCSDVPNMEAKFRHGIGFYKAAVIAHVASFYVVPLLIMLYCYNIILSGLANSNDIHDRIVYWEFKKVMYIEGAFFGITFAPQMIGLVLYHFTRGFPFGPLTESNQITLYTAMLNTVFHPIFSMDTNRIYKPILAKHWSKSSKKDNADAVKENPVERLSEKQVPKAVEENPTEDDTEEEEQVEAV